MASKRQTRGNKNNSDRNDDNNDDHNDNSTGGNGENVQGGTINDVVVTEAVVVSVANESAHAESHTATNTSSNTGNDQLATGTQVVSEAIPLSSGSVVVSTVAEILAVVTTTPLLVSSGQMIPSLGHFYGYGTGGMIYSAAQDPNGGQIASQRVRGSPTGFVDPLFRFRAPGYPPISGFGNLRTLNRNFDLASGPQFTHPVVRLNIERQPLPSQWELEYETLPDASGGGGHRVYGLRESIPRQNDDAESVGSHRSENSVGTNTMLQVQEMFTMNQRMMQDLIRGLPQMIQNQLANVTSHTEPIMPSSGSHDRQSRETTRDIILVGGVRHVSGVTAGQSQLQQQTGQGGQRGSSSSGIGGERQVVVDPFNPAHAAMGSQQQQQGQLGASLSVSRAPRSATSEGNDRQPVAPPPQQSQLVRSASHNWQEMTPHGETSVLTRVGRNNQGGTHVSFNEGVPQQPSFDQGRMGRLQQFQSTPRLHGGQPETREPSLGREDQREAWRRVAHEFWDEEQRGATRGQSRSVERRDRQGVPILGRQRDTTPAPQEGHMPTGSGQQRDLRPHGASARDDWEPAHAGQSATVPLLGPVQDVERAPRGSEGAHASRAQDWDEGVAPGGPGYQQTGGLGQQQQQVRPRFDPYTGQPLDGSAMRAPHGDNYGFSMLSLPEGVSPVFKLADTDNLGEVAIFDGTRNFAAFLFTFNQAIASRDITNPVRKLRLLKGKLRKTAAEVLETQERWKPQEMANYDTVVSFLLERFEQPLDITYGVKKLAEVRQVGSIREFLDQLMQVWVDYIVPLDMGEEQQESLLKKYFLHGIRNKYRARLDIGLNDTFEQMRDRALMIERNEDPPEESSAGKGQQQQQGPNKFVQQKQTPGNGQQGSRNGPSRYPNPNNVPMGGQNRPQCSNCGRRNHTTAQCRAPPRQFKQGLMCNACGGEGHYARECLNKPAGYQPPQRYQGSQQTPPRMQQGSSPPQQGAKGGSPFIKGQCYNCGGTDHYRRDCPQRNQSNQPAWGSGQQGAPKKKYCVHCRTDDHWTSQCTHVPAASATTNMVYYQPQQFKQYASQTSASQNFLATAAHAAPEITPRRDILYPNKPESDDDEGFEVVRHRKVQVVSMEVVDPPTIGVNQAKMETERYYMYIKVQCEGVEIKSLIDTGAQSTLMKAGGYRKHFAHHQLTPVTVAFTGFNNATTRATAGMFTAPLTLNGVTKDIKVFVVENLQSPMLFGDDALRAFGLVLDYKKRQVYMDGQQVPSFSAGPEDLAKNTAVKRLMAAQNIPVISIAKVAVALSIPAGVTRYVQLQVEKGLEGQDVQVQPCRDGLGEMEVMSPRGLLTVVEGKVILPFHNIGLKTVRMQKGQEVGVAEPVDYVATVVSAQTARDALDTLYPEMGSEQEKMDPQVVIDKAEAKLRKENEILDFRRSIIERAKRMGSHIEVPAELDVDSAQIAPDEKRYLRILVNDYEDVFMTPGEVLEGTTLVEHAIELKEGSTPIKQPYRNPLAYRKIITDEVNDMLAKKVIRPSNSPWASPVVIVRKKDGSIRFCVDYRALNHITIKDSHPLPRIDETLATLCGAMFFTTLDLQSGYWQIPMKVADIEKTAFSCHEGLFEHMVMPFGLSNAPASFQRLMQFVLKGLLMEFCMCYLDDVIIFSKSYWEHLFHFKQVLQRFRDAKLKLKAKKCDLVRQHVKFLGHVISARGIHPDPEKVDKVKQCKYPTSVKQVRQYLGLTGYYRQYIKGYGVIAAPLYDLTQACPKNLSFAKRWNRAAAEAFDQLREELVKAPILGYPDMELPFRLYTDASNIGLGFVLAQVDREGKERVICYGSKKLTDTETRYAVTEKECLAVIRAFNSYRQYLLGSFTTVYTDHLPLLRILDRKRKAEDITPRLLRMAMLLAEYSYEMKYVEGSKHTNADALSRPPFVEADDDEEVEPLKASAKLKKIRAALVKAGSCFDDDETYEGRTRVREANILMDLVKRYLYQGTIATVEIEKSVKKRSSVRAHASALDKPPPCEHGTARSRRTKGRKPKDVGSRLAPMQHMDGVGLLIQLEADENVQSSDDESDGDRDAGDEDEDSDDFQYGDAPGHLECHNPLVPEPLREPRVDEDQIVDELPSYEERQSAERGQLKVDLANDCKDLTEGRYFQYYQLRAPWNKEEIIRAQQDDDHWGELIYYLETLELPEMDNPKMARWLIAQEPYYVLWEGILYRIKRKKTPSIHERIEFQLVVPEVFTWLLMEMMHTTKYGAHLGIEKVLAKLQQKYYWPRMEKSIRWFIDDCIPCQRFRQGTNRRMPLQPIRAMAPFHMVAIDVIGPLPETDRGNKYIVTLMDYYTKWPEAYPTKDQTAQTIVDLLHERIIPQHGVPKVIITDRGPCFSSELFVSETAAVGAHVCYTSPYHHQANGLVERWNRTLMDMIKPTVELEPEKWDRYIGPVLFAYRSTPHASTGNTPFFLRHGIDPNLPMENPLFEVDKGMHRTEWAEEVSKALSEAWSIAAKKNRDMQVSYKEYYDRRAKDRDIRVGDLVLMKHREKLSAKRISNKFHPEFERLFRVIGTDGSKRIKLVLCGSPGQEGKWYDAEEFKHFSGSEKAYLNYEGRLRAKRNPEAAWDEDDAECPICNGTYIEDLKRPDSVLWQRCDYCYAWYHLSCIDRNPEETSWHCPVCVRTGHLVD